jgi:hypothetical protein
MEDTDFDLLSIGLSADEAKRLRKIFVEWCDGDENGFPVQLALLTRAQWRASASIPRALHDSRTWLELHLTDYRQQTAALINNLSAVGENQADELKKIVHAHTETVKHASVSIQDQLRRTTEAARQISRQLDDGVSAWNRAQSEMEAGREQFQKACKELDDRLTLRELRRDWFTLLGVISIGIIIGVVAGHVMVFTFQ